MAVHLLDFKAPSGDLPRMHPCSATGIGKGAIACGATPASQWQKNCPHGHERDMWLCGTHARLVTIGAGQCKECADRGAGAVPAVITPVRLLLAGLDRAAR